MALKGAGSPASGGLFIRLLSTGPELEFKGHLYTGSVTWMPS